MIQQALQKIQKEINDNAKNQWYAYVGGELINFVRSNPNKAELFTAEGKSIKGAFDAMRSEAQKIKTGNMAAFSPDEGMAIVLEYYGIKRKEPEPQPAAIGFNVDLEALLS